MSSTCKTIFYTKLVKTKTAPFTNPFHLTHYYNDHLPYKELLARPKKFNSYSYFDLEVQHTHTQKKYVDDYHTWGTTFYNNNNKIIYRQNCRDSMHYHIILPQNGLPSSFIISRKACEDSWCSLCSLTINSTTELKFTEKPCIGGATFLTPIYSLKAPKTIFLAALIWFKLRRRGV